MPNPPEQTSTNGAGAIEGMLQNHLQKDEPLLFKSAPNYSQQKQKEEASRLLSWIFLNNTNEAFGLNPKLRFYIITIIIRVIFEGQLIDEAEMMEAEARRSEASREAAILEDEINAKKEEDEGIEEDEGEVNKAEQGEGDSEKPSSYDQIDNPAFNSPAPPAEDLLQNLQWYYKSEPAIAKPYANASTLPVEQALNAELPPTYSEELQQAESDATEQPPAYTPGNFSR